MEKTGQSSAWPAPPHRQGHCWSLCGPREVPVGGAAGGRGTVGAEKLEGRGTLRLLEGDLKHTMARSAASEGRQVWPGPTAAQPQHPSASRIGAQRGPSGASASEPRFSAPWWPQFPHLGSGSMGTTRCLGANLEAPAAPPFTLLAGPLDFMPWRALTWCRLVLSESAFPHPAASLPL